MNKKQQDLSWACLPKEAREEIKKDYKSHPSAYHPYFNEGYEEALKIYFGHHNLTSDTEPSELLFVERKKILEYYKDVQQAIGEENGDTKIEMEGRKMAMRYFFGDKCLPDKENTLKSGELKSDKATCKENLQVEQPYDQVEPKFQKGDKFRFKKNPTEVHTIASIFPDGSICFWEEDTDGLSKQYLTKPEYIKPYTEPKSKFNAGDKVIVKANAIDCSNHIGEIIQEYDTDIYKVRITPCGSYILHVTDLEHYSELKTKDNMEEKELNLIEILKNCQKGERFFSLIAGDVTFQGVDSHWEQAGWKPIRCTGGDYNSDGTYTDPSDKGICCLYPSRALYKEYPLDAPRAWGVWASERKPKLVLQAEIRLISNDGKTIEDYENVEVEVSDVDLTQASEAVRECLEKFHESKNE